MPVKYSDYRKNTSEILDERRKIAEYNKQFPEETKVKKDTTLGGTLGYLLGKFGAGAASAYEGLTDAAAPALKSIGKITSSLMDNPIGRAIDKDVGDYRNNWFYQLGEDLTRDEVGKTLSDVVDDEFGNRSVFDDNSMATKFAAGTGRLLADISFGKMAGPIINIKNIDSTTKGAAVLNTLINQVNNPSMQAFMMDVFGSSYADAINNGATDDEAGLFALMDTAKEGGIEMLWGGVGGIFGKGALDDYITQNLVKLSKNKLIRMGIKTVSGAVGEGIEEVLAELMTPFTNYIYKHKLDFSNYNQLFDSFILGGLISLGLQGGRALYGKVLDPSTTVYEQIMGEYIDDLSTDVNTYTNAQNEILDRIDNSVSPDEIVELNEANTLVASTIEELKLRLDELTQLQKNTSTSSAEKIPDVLKVVPDVTEVDTNLKAVDSEGRTLTQQQADYFKDSKVRDENGNLLTVYHGTGNYGFDAFDYGKTKFGLFGQGFYFTDSMDVAKNYTNKGKSNIKGVYEVYLNITNPMDMSVTADSEWSKVKISGVPISEYLSKNTENATNEDYFKALIELLEDKELVDWEFSEWVTDTITDMGYDGIKYSGGGRFNKSDNNKHTAYIAFYPNQIKRINNNTPTSNSTIDEGASKKHVAATKKQTTKTVSEKKRGTITKDQIKTIHTLLGKDGKLKEEVYKEFGIKSSTELSKEKASELIERLNSGQSRSDKIESLSSDEAQSVKLKKVATDNEIKGVASEKILNDIDKINYKKANRTSEHYFAQNFVDLGFVFDNLADKIEKIDKKAASRLRAANDQRFAALTISFNQEFDKQIDYKTGEKIGKSIDEILKPFEKNGTIQTLQDYVYIKSNLERKTYGKDNKGIKFTEEQQKEFIKRMDSLHPEYKTAQKEINKYYRNLLYNEVGGRVDQELADYLTEKYEDYARFYNADANGLYLKGNKIMAGKPVKQATGGKYELTSLREAMVRATNASVSGVLDNNLRLELLNCLGGVQLRMTDKYQPVLSTDSGWMIVAYKNGVPYGIKVTKGMVDGLRTPGITEMEQALSKYFKIIKLPAEIRRKLLTELNPGFSLYNNPIKDTGDMIVNSKHTLKTIGKLPLAYYELATDGEIAQRYRALGGFASSYYSTSGKRRNRVSLLINRINQIIEQAPRLAEFMASIQEGATPQEAVYDAAEVTLNHKRGGIWTKALNNNGFTFLNGSVQGFYKQYRNLKGANGVKGYVSLLTKTVGLGILGSMFNELLYGDDEEYQNLPDYIKDQYYLFKLDIGPIKTPKGKFIRIPKGRVISIFDKAARNVNDIVKGRDNQFHVLKLLGFAYDQTGPNNPINENMFAPIFQAINNKKWTGDPIDNKYETDKSGSSYKLPKDRVAKNTSNVAKFISSLIPAEFDVSPKKIDYILDQYGGYWYDVIKPGITETEEYESLTGNPLMSVLFVDTIYSNKNISEIYDLVGPLKVEADKNKDDIDAQFRYKYVNSQLYQINTLYGEIRDYVVEHPHDNNKKIKEVTKQINDIANETIEKYKSIKSETITYDGKEYFISNGTAYRYDKNGTLRKCTSKVCKEVLNSK